MICYQLGSRFVNHREQIRHMEFAKYGNCLGERARVFVSLSLSFLVSLFLAWFLASLLFPSLLLSRCASSLLFRSLSSLLWKKFLYKTHFELQSGLAGWLLPLFPAFFSSRRSHG